MAFRADAIDRSIDYPKTDLGIFKKRKRGRRSAYPEMDDGQFGVIPNVWAGVTQALVGAGTAAYTIDAQKKMEQKRLSHEAGLIAMQEQTKRMEIAIQQKQAELLARASERSQESVSSPATASMMGITNPKTLMILTVVALVVGGGIYFITKK